jgi:hypothetical protein
VHRSLCSFLSFLVGIPAAPIVQPAVTVMPGEHSVGGEPAKQAIAARDMAHGVQKTQKGSKKKKVPLEPKAPGGSDDDSDDSEGPDLLAGMRTQCGIMRQRLCRIL